MRYPVKNWDSWYIAQGYGDKTSYGYHEGDDLNLKTGGDSDLGQPLLAIADGEVTSVHKHTTKPTFGNHIHIRHDGEWGSVWSHYAHCDSLDVSVGDKVVEGQEIAKLGKSGTDLAHCHFCIKIVPTGIDGIAKTKEDLKKWTSPIQFINKWKDSMPNCEEQLKEKEGQIKKLDKDVADARRDRGTLYVKLGVSETVNDDPGVQKAIDAVDDLKRQLADMERACQKQVNGLNNDRKSFFAYISPDPKKPIANYDEAQDLVNNYKMLAQEPWYTKLIKKLLGGKHELYTPGPAGE